MNILSVCSEPSIMDVLRYVVLFINVIKAVIPIVLIISIMLKFAGAVTSHNDSALTKVYKSAIPSVIAAVLIFIIPTFVDIIVRVSFPSSDYSQCISGITTEKVKAAYETKMLTLITNAEQSLEYTDYSSALAYLQYIKDVDKREEYEAKLSVVKSLIDEIAEQNKKKSKSGKYANINFYGFKWSYYDERSIELSNYYSDSMPYAVWGPEDPKEVSSLSLPLIIWLHGAVGPSTYCQKDGIQKHRFAKTVSNWSSTGLDPIPAIIIAPEYCHQREGSWRSTRAIETVKALIEYAAKVYNIDKSKVMLMGHSDGGSGVIYVSRSNQSLFAKLVIMSGFMGFNDAPDYYKRIPLRGYMTKNPARAADPNGGGDGNTGMERIFESIGRSSDLIQFPKDVTHDEVQEKALTTDDNKDGISDLMYWLFGEDAKVKANSSSGNNDVEIMDDDVTPGKFVADSGDPAKCNRNGKYQTCSPSRGIFGSFQYYDSNPGSTEDRWSLEMDSKWANENFVTLKKTCSNGWNLEFQMHRLAKTTWETVMDKLCQITTTGINGYKYEPKDFAFSGAKAQTVARFVGGTKSVSNHAYGTTIDINPSVKYTVDGKTYVPYNRDVKEYERFVAALGREDDQRNVNYIVWKTIFQPLGFSWGGNWGRNGNKSTYDGMHFEIDWKQTK